MRETGQAIVPTIPRQHNKSICEIPNCPKCQRITARTLRAKRIVQGLAESKPYSELGKETFPKTKYPRQSVYRSIQSKPVQDALVAEFVPTGVIWSAEEIVERIQREGKEAKSPADRLKALDLLGKTKAIFTEKREITQNQTFKTAKSLEGVSIAEMVAEMEQRLKLSSQGVNTSDSKDLAEVRSEQGKSEVGA